MQADEIELASYVRCVPDFPKTGIQFQDISPLLASPLAFRTSIEKMSIIARDLTFSHIVGIDSRGFIFGAALAIHMNKPFVMMRKPNKLPLASHSQIYDLEYGQDALEIQETVVPKTAEVLLLDDVIATGGTLVAAAKLIRQLDANVVGAMTLLEIKALKGSNQLQSNDIKYFSVLSV